MAKGRIQLSKGKESAPARNESVVALPEPFGRLFEPLASARRDIDRCSENLAPGVPRGMDFNSFRRLGPVFEMGCGDMVPHVEGSEAQRSYEISAGHGVFY